jgi:hypothetical protein
MAIPILVWGVFQIGARVAASAAGRQAIKYVVRKLTKDNIKKLGQPLSKHKTKSAANNVVKKNVKDAKPTKAETAKKLKAERKARKEADKKRAEEKRAEAKKKAEEKAKKKRQQEAKEKRKQEQKEQKDIADVEAGTKVPVKGAGKSPYSRREVTKPKETETLVRRPAGSKDPKTGEPRGGKFPKREEAGAPGSKTRRRSEAAVRARKEKKVLPWIIGGGAAAIGATGAIIAGRDQDLPAGYGKGPRPAPDAVSAARAAGLPKDAAAARVEAREAARVEADSKAKKQPSKKDALTNNEIAKQYDALAKLRRDETQRSGLQTVMWNGKEYGGGKDSEGDSKKLLRDINEYNKDRKKPEDPVRRVVKKIKKKITGKKGGGRVSSRPAKVMKQYLKGGSVRKPKRL